MVGVNDYLTEEKPIEILQIDPSVAARQSERLATIARRAVESRGRAQPRGAA